ncbi:MAG TPA: hypothetical protein VGE07_18800 [Herpetosiphonaceae bacterium]
MNFFILNPQLVEHRAHQAPPAGQRGLREEPRHIPEQIQRLPHIQFRRRRLLAQLLELADDPRLARLVHLLRNHSLRIDLGVAAQRRLQLLAALALGWGRLLAGHLALQGEQHLVDDPLRERDAGHQLGGVGVDGVHTLERCFALAAAEAATAVVLNAVGAAAGVLPDHRAAQRAVDNPGEQARRAEAGVAVLTLPALADLGGALPVPVADQRLVLAAILLAAGRDPAAVGRVFEDCPDALAAEAVSLAGLPVQRLVASGVQLIGDAGVGVGSGGVELEDPLDHRGVVAGGQAAGLALIAERHRPDPLAILGL